MGSFKSSAQYHECMNLSIRSQSSQVGQQKSSRITHQISLISILLFRIRHHGLKYWIERLINKHIDIQRLCCHIKKKENPPTHTHTLGVSRAALNRAEQNREQCVRAGPKLLQSRLSVSNLCWLTGPQ